MVKIVLLVALLFFFDPGFGYAKEFQIFDLITAINKPDDLPMKKMHMIYQWHAYGGKYTSDREKNYLHEIPEKYMKCCYVKHNLSGEMPAYFSIDLEQWKLYDLDAASLGRNIEYHKKTFRLIREILPVGAKISWYNTGALPYHGLHKSNASNKSFREWQETNNKIGELVVDYDFMQPSLYYLKTYTIPMWKNMASKFISEHRRLGAGKPVYVHLSPQYVDEPGELLPINVWKEMLKHSYENSDGVIIWTFTHKEHRLIWDDKAEWWMELKQYINKNTH